jgi:DNA-binding NarL/FixJ family response regulator
MPEPYRLLLAGDWQGAADAWARIGAPFDEAMALLEGGPEAQRRALAIFEGLGAARVAEHARGLLRQSGTRIVAQGPRASTRSNPAGLTRRQMDVLRLLDEGHSNAAIGERLFVSPKTVDHHVSAILAKLEVRTRGEAAAAARRVRLI